MSVKWCVVCSAHYEQENIKSLEGAFNSIEKLENVVKTELGIPDEDAVFLYDYKFHDIYDRLMMLKESLTENDTVVFYFCGHGVKIQNNLYLFANSTKKECPEMSALDYNVIIHLFRTAKVREILVVLDCCNSGAAITMGSEDQDDARNEVTYEGEVILCSCSALESSIEVEIEDKKYSVFTYVFSEVLSEGIDSDKEYLSIKDIFDRVKDSYENKSGRTLCVDRKQNFDEFQFVKNMEYTRKVTKKKSEELQEIRNKFHRRPKWKILLVKCKIKYPTRGIDFGIPLGLWVLKNYITLEKPNVQVDIYDERLLTMQEKEKDFENAIKDYNIIGISMCTCEVFPALEKFRIAHRNNKITVAGGIFTYSNERYLVESGYVDYVIPGVGTVPWVKLINTLMENDGNENKIINVNNVFSENNMDTSVWITDTMPGLEFHEWDEILYQYGVYSNKNITENYQEHSIKRIDVVTSRGCNKNCNFCSVRFESGSRVVRKPEYIILDEISYLYDKGIRYFSIKDEDFFLYGFERAKNILEFCREIPDIHFKIRMRLDAWDYYGDKLNLKQLHDWGVDEIQYGVESPQSDILRILRKGMSFENEKITNLFKKHYDNQIKVNASFILGCTELEDADYYKRLESFIDSVYDEHYFIPYINFYTPHPTHSTIEKDKYTVVSNNLNYYTHKIPVAFPKNINQPAREKMVETYEKITERTKSLEYNPQIPPEARNLFIRGQLETTMRYI